MNKKWREVDEKELQIACRHITGLRCTKTSAFQKVPLMTIAIVSQPTDVANDQVVISGIGISICSALEMPDRSKGRTKAKGRALGAFKKASVAGEKAFDPPEVSQLGWDGILMVPKYEIPFVEALMDNGLMKSRKFHDLVTKINDYKRDDQGHTIKDEQGELIPQVVEIETRAYESVLFIKQTGCFGSASVAQRLGDAIFRSKEE